MGQNLTPRFQHYSTSWIPGTVGKTPKISISCSLLRPIFIHLSSVNWKWVEQWHEWPRKEVSPTDGKCHNLSLCLLCNSSSLHYKQINLVLKGNNHPWKKQVWSVQRREIYHTDWTSVISPSQSRKPFCAGSQLQGKRASPPLTT